MASLGTMIELLDVGMTTKSKYEEGHSLPVSLGFGMAESLAWSVAPGIMFSKMALDISPEMFDVADTLNKRSKSIYEDELGRDGEVGNAEMRSNQIQQSIERSGMNAIRENQRNLNKHFGDEARRYSRR